MTEESNNSIGTWGALVGVVGGAALGYWAGRSSDGCGWNNHGCGSGVAAAAYNANGFNEFQAGKTQAELTAGLNYTAQTNAAIRNDICNLGAQMNANFQRLEDRQFNMLVAENGALKSELNTTRVVAPITNQLVGLNTTVGQIDRAFMPGYVRAVPLCGTCCSCVSA